MKKIPTLFEREFKDHNVVNVLSNVMKGMEWVLGNEGLATVKYDGACCAVLDGVFYKRYDAKKGRSIPEGAIKCQEEADPITGHLPCWVKVNENDPSDKWFVTAMNHYLSINHQIVNGTYEAVGKHFRDNPYRLDHDTLIKHGEDIIEVERSFDGIKKYLKEHDMEGIVFWKDGEPKCKIKRSDFGFPWNSKK